MREASESQLLGYRGWALRVRASRGEPKRLLLMIHGWTGDENSMWVFARGIPDDYWVIAPRAPHATRPSGYSWRVPPPDRSDGPAAEELEAPAEALIALTDEYCRDEKIPSETFDVIGFSQGAAVAATLALLHPKRVSKVALLAGFVPGGAGALAAGRPLEGVKVFIAHGSMDELVSIEYARQSAKVLEQAGGTVTVCEADVGHKVSADCMRALQAFLLG